MDSSQKATAQSQPSTAQSGTKRLFNDEELKRLKQRQRRGQMLRVVTFLPIILGIGLILFVFGANIDRVFAWQLVAPASSSSGQLFDWSDISSRRDALVKEFEARGEGEEAREALTSDANELRIFWRRHRVDYLLSGNGEPRQVYVWSSRDDIEEQYGFLYGLFNREELRAEAEENDYLLFLNPMIDLQFLQRGNSRSPQLAGFYNALVGTLWVIALVIFFSAVVGIGSAIYLEEYAPRNKFTDFLEVNLRNLAGVPSIVYGILGLYVFVRALSFERSVISAALTLTLLILPVVIIAAREAIKGVPDTLRQASYGLGATKWQTVRQVILPNSISGIVTGVILAIARAIGETAPLLLVGGAGLVTSVPGGWDVLKDTFTVMPLQIYTYFGLPNQDAFLPVASAGILVLLGILIVIYLIAFVIRARFERNW